MSDNPFAELERTPEMHFVVNFHAAMFILVSYLREVEPMDAGESADPADAVARRFPFLGVYMQQVTNVMPDGLTWDEAPAWWRATVEEWELRRLGHLPLGALTRYGKIGFAERMGLICAGLVEEDARFGDLFDTLQAGTGSRRATVELIGRLILHTDGEVANSPRRACERLLRHNLIELREQEAAFADRPAVVPEPVWKLIRHGPAKHLGPGLHYRPRNSSPRIKSLVFPDAFIARLTGLPRLLRRGGARLLVVRGRSGSLREQIVGAVARALRRNLIRIEADIDPETARLIAPLALMTRSVAMARVEAGQGETVTPPRLPGYRDYLGLVLGRAGGVDAESLGGSIALELPALGPAERLEHWRRGLKDHLPDPPDELVARYLLPGGHIRSVARSALAYMRLAGRTVLALEDAADAHRQLNRQYLEGLASPVPAASGWGSLITAPSVDKKLRELERRCRFRETLPERLGPAFGRVPNLGVRALFNGPSGTGKTLAAQTLGAELGMDIYRVDLAAVVNKYIGETEKNLDKVLSRAEALDIILLIDEGDALMGKRTDVTTANDRYANLETNYLLQRLELHQGIVLVTTNLGENVDSAFQRRMDLVVTFLPPSPAQRERILHLHLPTDHRVPEASLKRLAQQVKFTGGQIRNVAMHAALLAIERNGGHVTEPFLLEAVESEYRKAGAVSPMAVSAPGAVPATRKGSGGVGTYVAGMRGARA